MRLLSGRRHSVLTAYCIKHNSMIVSQLKQFENEIADEEEIGNIDSRDWVGCAGGYSIQGRAKCFFPFISGCYSNVVGLPLPSLIGILRAMGYYKIDMKKD